MKVVDASVWVSRLVPGDVHNKASRDWFERYTSVGGRLVSPVLLLTEVAGAIARRTGKPELAHQAVKRLLNIPSLRLVASDQQLGTAAARLAADLRLRGADAMYVAVAYRLNIPLVTWDREQLERTQNFIVAYTPEDDEMFLTWR